MKVFYFNSVYFLSKGTVIFCLGKDNSDREIKEIKKSKIGNNIYIRQ
jgi:hypothetical protein